MRNSSRGRILFIILGLAAFVQASCSAFDDTARCRCYEPPSRPITEVSILKADEEHDLTLKRIEGWGEVNNNWFDIELLPGPHTLTFGFYISGLGRAMDEKSITFRAEPGMLYVAKGSLPPLDSRDVDWRVSITLVGPIPKDYKRPEFQRPPGRE
jgi:hypothetical protein